MAEEEWCLWTEEEGVREQIGPLDPTTTVVKVKYPYTYVSIYYLQFPRPVEGQSI